jgi:hypothetical protein
LRTKVKQLKVKYIEINVLKTKKICSLEDKAGIG